MLYFGVVGKSRVQKRKSVMTPFLKISKLLPKNISIMTELTETHRFKKK